MFPQAARANPSYSGTIGQVRAQLTNNMFAKHRSFGVDVPIGGTNTNAGSMPTGDGTGFRGGISRDTQVKAQQSYAVARQAILNDKQINGCSKNNKELVN